MFGFSRKLLRCEGVAQYLSLTVDIKREDETVELVIVSDVTSESNLREGGKDLQPPSSGQGQDAPFTSYFRQTTW